MNITRNVLKYAPLALICLISHPSYSRTPEPTQDIGLNQIGYLSPKNTKSILSSSWSIGGETLDRDFADYDSYKMFLSELGAKSIRLQAGWTKTEKHPGSFDWTWLDHIIEDALSRNIQPWIQISYGNPSYPDGGGKDLGGGFPKSDQALNAWDNWVSQLVMRYADRVWEWEIWNEPDSHNPDDYAKLYIRTAEIVRQIQPNSKIIALSLAGNVGFAKAFFNEMRRSGNLHLIDVATVHGYPDNPDNLALVKSIQTILKEHGNLAIEIRQGETGAPSQWQDSFALKNIDWTETKQSKWNMRRMLSHHGNGVPVSLFTISDLHYVRGSTILMNYKGLLRTDEQKKIVERKESFYSAQHIFSLFDSSLVPEGELPYLSEPQKDLAVYRFRDTDSNQVCVTYWIRDSPPTDQVNAEHLNELRLLSTKFNDPALVDLRTGAIYRIPASSLEVSADSTTFLNLPVYDSPFLIIDISLLAKRHFLRPAQATTSPSGFPRFHLEDIQPPSHTSNIQYSLDLETWANLSLYFSDVGWSAGSDYFSVSTQSLAPETLDQWAVDVDVNPVNAPLYLRQLQIPFSPSGNLSHDSLVHPNL